MLYDRNVPNAASHDSAFSVSFWRNRLVIQGKFLNLVFSSLHPQ